MKQAPPSEKRQRPLPDHRPNPSADDPAAPARIEAVIASPSYRRSDRDPDFLQRADMRGVRLMLDYLKPQTLLTEHDVAHTIVVFGGTRIPEPAVAHRAVAELAAAAAASPQDADLQRRLEIARQVAINSRYYEVARQFGRLVGACGDKAIGGRIMIMNGGGPGSMEAAPRRAGDNRAGGPRSFLLCRDRRGHLARRPLMVRAERRAFAAARRRRRILPPRTQGIGAGRLSPG